MIRVVLDTNILVAAFRSREGASFRVLSMVGPEAPFRCSLSVPLVLEYESALRRLGRVEDNRIDAVLDYLCVVGDLREIYYLWRPFLRDPGDEMVLEVAVGAHVSAIVTHNVRDFAGVEDRFGIRVIRPGAFLLELEEMK
ncbi:MAG: PIN domain-containing protein [Gemmatimonadota bacterium]|nr:PIN domain-containing protein [Gemmatimonadota bacterium]